MPNTLSRVSAPHLSDRSRNRHRAGTRNRCPSTAQYIPLPIHCQYGGMPLIPVIRANLGGPRLHGNDDGRRRCTREAAGAPTSHSPTARGRRWVPVSTGTTMGGGPTSSFPQQRAGMGSRLHGNDDGRRAPTIVGIHGPTSSFPRRRESMAGGRRGRSPSPRERRAHPHRHSREGGNPWRGAGPGMGSRLHGNDDGRRRRTHNRRWAAGAPTFPRRWAV